MAPGRRGGGGRGRRPRAPSGCAHPGSPRRRRARSPPGRRRGARTPRGARSTPAGDCDRRTAMEDPLAALAARVAGAPYCARLGVVVEAIALDRARIRVPYKDENSNPGRAPHGGVPAAAGGEVPKLARAIVSVPFMASLGLAITHMQDGRALVHMPLTPDKTDHDGAIHEGALAALLDTTGAMASWSIAGLDLRYKAS